MDSDGRAAGDAEGGGVSGRDAGAAACQANPEADALDYGCRGAGRSAADASCGGCSADRRGDSAGRRSGADRPEWASAAQASATRGAGFGAADAAGFATGVVGKRGCAGVLWSGG